MSLTQLSLTNFRSYGERTVPLDASVTLVVGPNATGKTNLLESLFVLATTKSFRAKDTELIGHGQEFYRIVAKQDDNTELAMAYQVKSGSAEKRVHHGKTPKSLIDHLGTIRVVLFEPNDSLLIYGGPDRRRRYLDFVLTQTDKHYAKSLNLYRRTLQQRNHLLADWGGNTAELFAWNIQLAQAAAEIDERRRAVVGHINGLAVESYRIIAGSAEPLELTYHGTAAAADYAASFLKLLEAGLSRDIAAGFTTIGPHRDDFSANFKDAPIASVASRGEIRTVVLALKMAELAYIQDHTGSKPLLLLDDVFSELDDSRRQHLLDTLGNYQAVVTTTNADISSELGARHAIIYTTEPHHG
ncbi:MAG TPA: DNA replication/repair protein RecF [Candidatus Saccharimonadia bacterium]